MVEKIFHIPVMAKEAVKFLDLKSKGVYVDATLGGGGHTAALLRKSQISNIKSQILVVGIDQDEEAIDFAKKRLASYRHAESLGPARDKFISVSLEIPKRVRDDLTPQVIFVQDNFRHLDLILDNLKILKVDGILLDLGVSSYQLENPKRGFSFRLARHPELDSGSVSGLDKIPKQVRNDILLDMRMDQRQKLSAFEVVNEYNEEELRQIFFELGEEPFSRQIARAIVIRRREKPIKTTNDLLDIIRGATPPKYRFSRRGHYASKIFRAIRIEVNQELSALREVLPQAVARLKKNGRLVVISFHSLEDRIVKHFFRGQKNEGLIEILTKKPLLPTNLEIELNPRAESAKLRAIEKI